MDKLSIYHVSEQNFAYAISKDELNIRLKTKKNDLDKVFIYYKNLYDHTDFYFKKEMSVILTDEHHSIYECTIQVKECRFKYYFELYSPAEKAYYTADGFLDSVHEHNCFYYPVINQDEILSLPQWAKGKIIYQILIDRFYDADPSNNPPNTKSADTLPDRNTYYGGDFLGVIEKLDYIKSLGADILYLSPVFLSPTYHKYDIKDYYAIEEIYGGKKALKEMIDTAHQKGIKVILDGVFNHCSSEHEIFKDVIKNGEKSRYKDWFFIDSFPIDVQKGNYDSFGGLVPSMPRFNTSNPEVIDYFCKVCTYWTKELDIDGWRMDVADEVSHVFWQTLRRELKAINSQLLLVGEVWNHASKWLQGNEFDTVTNYKFRKWVLDFVKGDISSQTLWDKINANNMLYKTPLQDYMINLLGSHDTIRYATYLEQNNLSLLAMILTLTMPGMPLIYYGDEYAQAGDVDPDNRRAMQWHLTKNNDFLSVVQAVASLRKASKILQYGSITPIFLHDKVVAFQRQFDNQKIIVIVNFGEHAITYNHDAHNLILGNGEWTKDNITVGPKDFVILE